MKKELHETIREINVLGIDKPKSLLKPSKTKNNPGFLIVTLVILTIMAIIVYYLD